MNRNPRSTTPCRPPPSRGGCAGAETTAALAQAPCRARLKKSQIQSTIPKRGPPPAPPKKLDYKKPTMTKAMAQRLKHTQKLQEEIARKEAERTRKVHRTAAPIGGDARLGRERRPGDKCRPTSAKQRPTIPCSSTHIERPQRTAGTCNRERSERVDPSVPTRTRNLAKSMHADIIQAEPLQPGPVDNLIIPPGAINSEKTTIVSIPQPEPAPMACSTMAGGHSGNKSVQVISESLDEQEAAETAALNNKLQDLQQARRDFVMAVASVSGNAINLQDDDDPGINLQHLPNVTPISDITPPMLSTPGPPTPILQRCPSLDDPYLQIEYGRNHPVVEAARDYMRTRAAACEPDDYEPEYLECCGIVRPEVVEEVCAPTYTTIPRRQQPYQYLPMEINRLERFFDLQNYPAQPAPATPPHQSVGAPPGRECLPEDLWDLEDPWYREESHSDLIQW